jgi:integrase
MLLTANILSLTTGMRQGEILGLQNHYVFPDHVVVMWSWSKKNGMVEPKWGSRRAVPIPTRTAHYNIDDFRAVVEVQEKYFE